MWYNTFSHTNRITGRFVFHKAAILQSDIVGKAPLISGFVPAVRVATAATSERRFTMQTYICVNCGKKFEDYPSNRRKGKNGNSCSRKCKGEYQTKLANDRAQIKITSVCVDCNQEKPVGDFYKDSHCRANGYIQYSCKECVKEQRKVYYDQNSDAVRKRVARYQELHPGRLYHGPTSNRSHRLLNYAIEKGRMEKPTECSECGKDGRLHAHHPNGYDDPYDVVWLCPSCHHAAHGRGPKARLCQRKPLDAGGR